MTIVKHRSNAVKTETVKMEFLKPIFTIAQQEMHNLILTIVKTQAIPCGMLMPVTWIKILVRITC